MMWGNQRKQKEALIKENESWLHEELITTFNGRHKVPLCIFTAEELIRATNNFIHPINRNPYIKFCGGSLEQCSVLVKNLLNHLSSRQEQIHDIVIASQMSHHKNVWKLVGCCLEFEIPVMVYENNVGVDILDDLLFHPYETDDPRILAWTSRLRIANDIASAIVYLHMAFPTPIVYKNLSAHNIVVDRSGVGKLFDFSKSVSLPPGELDLKVDNMVGVAAFMAPECIMYGTVSQKTDVYAFGILLLVLLTGKNTFFSDMTPMESSVYLPRYVDGKEFNEIVDPKILSEGGAEHEHQLQAFLQLALKCIQREAENRPEMLDVAKELRKIKKYLGLKKIPNVPVS